MEGQGLGHLFGEHGCLISDLVGVGNAPSCWLESPLELYFLHMCARLA